MRPATDSAQSGTLPGARPVGALDEREAEHRVREMFSQIAPRYDFLNHLLSLSFDRLWRRRTSRRFAHILQRPEARVLDVCCGTGDLILMLERQAKELHGAAGEACDGFIGADFAMPMLGLARGKASRAKMAARFLAADALRLPFADASFDLVTTAFGFRNLANYACGLREFARVLRPGGELGILEFGEPRSGVASRLYRFYFSRILPWIGGAVSGNSAAYSYLPESVGKFPRPEMLKELMESAGFREVRLEKWTFGIVTLYRGMRGQANSQ